MGAAEALGGFLQNVLDGAVGIAKHVAVPQADNPPAFAFQKSRSAAIGFALLGMMAAIELETQLCLPHARSMMNGGTTSCLVNAGR